MQKDKQTMVRVTLADGTRFLDTLAAFFRENVDGIDQRERRAIRQCCARGEAYYGGGGAFETWIVKAV